MTDTLDEPPTSDALPRRARHVAPIVVGAVAIVLVGLLFILWSSDSSPSESAQSPLLGNPAPGAVGQFADGSEFELSRRKGSWVVLNFFTHNCVPCIREHPDLIEFVAAQEALGVDGAEFYSIVRDSSAAEVDAFFDERGGDWPVVYDTEFEFVNQFGVALVPETWIIDPNGFVRRRIISEVRADDLSQLMQALREGAA